MLYTPTALIDETIFTKAALYKYSIIVGDFNVNKAKLKQIKIFLDNSTFKKAVTPPTFIMTNNPDSSPDLILYTENMKKNISIQTVTDIGSDHLGFEIVVDIKKAILEEQLYKINTNKCNTTNLNQKLSAFLLDNRNTSMSETFIEDFDNKLSKTVLEESPKTKITHYIYELPPYIIGLIKTKRKMYREYLENKNPVFNRHLNEYNKGIQNMIRQYRESKWIATCNDINQQDGKNYWHQINKVTKYKPLSTIPTLTVNGQDITDDKRKADAFADYFRQAYTFDNDQQYNEENLLNVRRWAEMFFQTRREEEVEEIDEATYFRIISLGKSTSPGNDFVTKKILRSLEYNTHLKIIEIYNFCLKQQIFPSIWKKGQIITIPKSNSDHSQVNNFRPITLLPVLGKTLEIIIKERLQQHLGEHIPIYQFGFKQKRSTTLPVSILTSNIQTAKLTGHRSAAIFLDINKAFDSVWHSGLLFKLWKLDCPQYLIVLINNYLQERQLQIKIQKNLSGWSMPYQGVPQGSPLSPLLYNIYCHDIYKYPQDDPKFFDPKSYILQFADDTALISHNSNITSALYSLQLLMDQTMTWFNQWRLKPNPIKSQFLIFNHHIKPNSPTININNHAIKPQSSAKYLGINIDQKLNFNYHTQTIKTKCVTRGKHFRSLTYKQQGISLKTAAHIYQSICRPLLEYCHPLYLNCRPPAIKNLKVAETTTLRTITKMRHPQNPLHNPSNQLLYELTKVEPITTRLKDLSIKFASQESNIQVLHALCNNEIPPNRRRVYPETSLYQSIIHLQQ